eukprot:TRINITY_DN13560_c0_g1_i1.p2 TRINITY_DN13560_c0_g1~~TRINITY_DN13560_c0_g1_i1.p2  ORF type:complete len:130 (-),score=51.12 TRINITY_DN13560_c0_g1_i1:51-440(-)
MLKSVKTQARPSISYCGFNFCPDCKTIFGFPDENGYLSCSTCGFVARPSDFEGQGTEQSSTLLQRKHNLQKVAESQIAVKSKGATIDQECEECGNDKMYFTTAQLRSADEGQTVFYECTECGHSFNINT